MKRRFNLLKKSVAGMLALAIALGSLTGCGAGNASEDVSNDASGSTSAVAESAAFEGSIVSAGETSQTENALNETQELNLILTSDLKTLDVNDVRNSNEFQILSQVQEGLFRTFTDENGNATVENAGCESYEVSEDKLTYTFHLRDMNWSDGVPVTAQNYVDSFKRLLDPVNAFSYSFLALDIKNANAYYEYASAVANGESTDGLTEVTADELGIVALDDKTLEITLEAAIPFFVKKLTNVCFYPIRTDVIEAGGETWANDFEKQVYDGPFVIESRILENEMILAKNENYWDADNVHLTKVTLTTVAEASTQSQLLESKQLDVVQSTTDYVEKWKSMVDAGALVNRSVVSPSCNYMIFNQHTGGLSGLMNNEKVRLALSLAIDRDELNQLIYNGQNTPAYGLVPFNLACGDGEYRSAFEEPLKAVTAQYDSDEKIVELFQEGLAEEGKSGDVTLTLLSSAGDTQNEMFLEYIKQSWESALGIKVVVNIAPDSATFVTERNANNYDSIYMGWNGDYDDPMTFMELWNTGSGYARFMGGYSNEQFDEWFYSLDKITDSKERLEIYKNMEQNLIAENAGLAPLYYRNTQFFVQSYVKNLSTPNFGADLEFSRAYISGKE